MTHFSLCPLFTLLEQTMTRKLCYRKDVHTMHNLKICSWFEARKSICTI